MVFHYMFPGSTCIFIRPYYRYFSPYYHSTGLISLNFGHTQSAGQISGIVTMSRCPVHERVNTQCLGRWGFLKVLWIITVYINRNIAVVYLPLKQTFCVYKFHVQPWKLGYIPASCSNLHELTVHKSCGESNWFIAFQKLYMLTLDRHLSPPVCLYATHEKNHH